MRLLGLSAFYHDSAAALVENGKVTCAVEEERFTRIKHDFQFPINALRFCLEDSGLKIDQVDYVVHYEKPLLRFERVLDNFVRTYPFSIKPFVRGVPEWIDEKLHIEQKIRKSLGFKGEILYIPHHASHAAASYYPSGFQRAAILTVDGIGEYQTTGLWLGTKNKLTPLRMLDFPHSLGLFYSTFTAFLGFQVNEDEYKVMGLAAYGKPTYVDKILKTLDSKEDGSLKLDTTYYSFPSSVQMWSKKFEALFGAPRLPHDDIEKRHKEIAASCQTVMELIYFKMMNYLYSIAKTENLCISGGVALNALANGKIYSKTQFKKVYILGPSGDGGSAAGAALFAYHHIFDQHRRYQIDNLSLGPQFSADEIKQALDKYALAYRKYERKALIAHAARLLAGGKVVGWFQGRMEYGPRALGNRSILARPNPRKVKQRVNYIKIREQFRPFAGSILQDKVHKYFEVPEPNHRSPFMLFCFKVKEEKRSELAAIVHEDHTCRVQTVTRADNRLYYDLIEEFERLTGTPCILNTSFNLKGEPIVVTPDEAIKDFLRSKMDCLVIGDFIVTSKEGAISPGVISKEKKQLLHGLLH